MYSFNREEHIHSWQGKPLIGTTTCLKVLAKPLTWWASGLCAEKFGWLNPKKSTKEERLATALAFREVIRQKDIVEYVEYLDEAYRAHNTKKEDAADKGIDLHSQIEEFIKNEMTNQAPMFDYDDKIKPFIEWSKKNVKKWLWSEVYLYDTDLWVGGIADLGYINMNGKVVLGDIKSSKDAYFDQFVQLGGYDLQIFKNGGFDAVGNRVMERIVIDEYAIFPFGKFKGGAVDPVIRTETPDFKIAFKAALEIYKIIQKYDKD